MAFVSSRQFGIALALLSLAWLLIYVYCWAPYQEFLFTDMKKYWTSTLARLEGGGREFLEPQFVAWPPLYHIILAELFRVFRWIGLEGLIRLETALTINMVAFAASVYALQRLAVQWFDRPEFVLATMLLYAFGFPAWYFNAFLLSGNLGMPLMIISFALIVHKCSWWSAVVGALLFGIAVLIRPSFGPYGLAFIIYYLALYRISWKFVRRASVFSAVFFLVAALGSAEVARISQGKVVGLSGNGGLDFFIAMSHYHRVDVSYAGWHFFVIVPAVSWKPENGSFYTDVPFYNQDYYFKLGWDYIKHDPSLLIDNFSHVRDLFFADMLPTRNDAPGFKFWRPVWDWFKFMMFLTIGLYFWAGRYLGTRLPAFTMLSSVVGLTLLVSFVFTGEPRYTYSIIFAFYLLFFKLIEIMSHNRRRWIRPLAIYASLLVMASSASAMVVELRRLDLGDRNVHIGYIPLPEFAPPGSAPVEFDVRRVLFPHSKTKGGMIHLSAEHSPMLQPGTVHIHTTMEITGDQPLPLTFEMYSSWTFRMYINGVQRFAGDYTDYFNEMDNYMELQPGVYKVEFVVDYVPVSGGFAVNYNYWEPDGWKVRRVLGLDSERIRFSSPVGAVANQ
ncbi:MAG TPA: hypothetical protein VFX02_05950 [Gammaproteobacteria bacterium]|nr:hypothetical protein [Gammaproteobacteria bacterium]